MVTRYDDQPSARQFIRRLEHQGIKTYTHRAIKGYPADVDRIKALAEFSPVFNTITSGANVEVTVDLK